VAVSTDNHEVDLMRAYNILEDVAQVSSSNQDGMIYALEHPGIFQSAKELFRLSLAWFSRIRRESGGGGR
jgi:hypothetical protein